MPDNRGQVMRGVTSLAMLPVLALLGGCATMQEGTAPPPTETEQQATDTAQSAAEAAGDAAVYAGATGADYGEAMNAAFGRVAESYIDATTRLNPVSATQLGKHDYDGDLPEISAAGREEKLKVATGLLAALGALDRAALTPDNQVDAAMLDNALRYEIWQIEQEQAWAWDPQYYNNIASTALYSLIARDFAPWPQRLQSAVSRMEKLPAFLAEARRQIDPARVPLVHAQTVARQNAGIMAIVEQAIVPEVVGSGVDRTHFDTVVANLRFALDEHQKWLDEQLVPNAGGDFRLGADLYDKKMGFALMSAMARPELKASAQQAYADTRAEMERIARTLPGCAAGTQQQAIECGLAKSYAVRAPRAEVEARARETLEQTTAFTREKGFVGMPSGPVQVITMPAFSQGVAVAYDDPPGALEKHLPNYYAVSPIPADWSEEQANSFLSEYNMYMLHDLSIHEGVPGHYLQLDHANRNDDVLRAVLMSGPFVEGWAVYSEGVMSDLGYLDGDPLFKLTVLKMRLRSIINTLLDIGIHSENMSRDDAMKLMTEGGFQQEREAAGKWMRAQLTSTQLLSYFTGYAEHVALRKEAEKRLGAQFNLRAYHDELLSHGSPPVKYARALMFGEKVE